VHSARQILGYACIECIVVMMRLGASCVPAVDSSCGVFKARKSRVETRGAEEVKDSDETVRDLPIDLQDAAPVEVYRTRS